LLSEVRANRRFLKTRKMKMNAVEKIRLNVTDRYHALDPIAFSKGMPHSLNEFGSYRLNRYLTGLQDHHNIQ